MSASQQAVLADGRNAADRKVDSGKIRALPLDPIPRVSQNMIAHIALVRTLDQPMPDMNYEYRRGGSARVLDDPGVTHRNAGMVA
jgi:hypothetical protein